jgi:hypothetical protein
MNADRSREQGQSPSSLPEKRGFDRVGTDPRWLSAFIPRLLLLSLFRRSSAAAVVLRSGLGRHAARGAGAPAVPGRDRAADTSSAPARAFPGIRRVPPRRSPPPPKKRGDTVWAKEAREAALQRQALHLGDDQPTEAEALRLAGRRQVTRARRPTASTRAARRRRAAAVRVGGHHVVVERERHLLRQCAAASRLPRRTR